MSERENLWPGWETVRLIGRGSFGAVYEIERDVFGHKEKAALKAITIPQSSSDIEELYDSGYDEASVTATFKSHLESIVNEYSLMREMNGAANVVNCDDFRIVPHDDNIGWDIYIKMELLTPLTKALDRQPGEEQVVQIAKNMCNALILCRKYGIIHRDIKPQNIFVSKNGDYKLGDFGIAKTIEKTTGGTKIGTYKYMAPEVYNNQPYNLTADIYSLGLVLHWMLNERRSPFMPLPPAPAVASQEDEARAKRFGGTPIPAPAHGSKELKRIVLKACAFDPKDRYQTADEMLHDLNALDGAKKPQDTPAAVPPVILPAEEAEEDKTVGAWTSPAAQPRPEEDKTVGAWAVPEKPATEAATQPEEDKTVGVWTQTPEAKKPEPAPTPAPAPKKTKKKKWWLAAVAAVAVAAVAIAGTCGGKTAQTIPAPTAVPTAVPEQASAIASALDHSHPLGEAGFNGECAISVEEYNGTIYYHREDASQIKAVRADDLTNSTVIWRAAKSNGGNIQKMCVINNYIFFTYQPTGNGKYVLARIDIDGNNYTELSDDFLYPYYIDGWIYGQMLGGSIVRVAADGTRRETLTDEGGPSLFLSNSEDGLIAYYSNDAAGATYSYRVDTGETKKVLDHISEHITMYNDFLYATVYNGSRWQVCRFKEGSDPTTVVSNATQFVILDDLLFYRVSDNSDELFTMNLNGTGATTRISLPFSMPEAYNSVLRFISSDGFIAIKGEGGSLYLYMPNDGSIVKLP